MTLTVEKKKDDKVVEKITYTFTDIWVASLTISPTAGEKVTETVTFDFTKMAHTYYQTDDAKKLQTATQGWTVTGP